MASTGAKLPTSGTSVSASPWSDNAWTSPGNVTAIDSTYASVTASTFDTNDQTHRLRCVGFDFSSIPDGATINGISVTIHNADYANGSGSIDLAQLVEGETPLGNNKYSTAQALTTTPTDYSLGGTSDVWGATLTAAIVKSATFGIDLGCLSTAANTDVFIDAVEMTVEYTAPVTTITLTPSSDSVAPGEYAIFTATVSLDGTPTSGQTVTAASSNTGTGVVFVADEQASSSDMTWRNNSVPSPTYSAPGGTSPLGATIRRFTEAAATTYHQGGWSFIDHTNMAAGDKIIVVLEVKVTNATAVAIASYSNTDGTVAYNAALNPSTGATATNANYGTINSSTTADLGSGWWLWIVEYTYAAGSDGSMLPSVALSNTTTATIPSYAGNTSNYMDIGVCTIYVQRASPSTTTTDGSGEQLIFVRGVAAGTSNITATANSVTSDASVLTVSSSGTYNEDITDSGALTDTPVASLVATDAVSDSAAGTETLASTGVFAEAVSDSADATDAVTAGAAYAASAEDTAAATDAAENTLSKDESVSDTAAATETVAAGLIAVDAVADTADGSESLASTGVFSDAVSDSGAATDAETDALVVVEAVSDAGALTDESAGETAAIGQGGDAAPLPHLGLLFVPVTSFDEDVADSAAGSETVAGALTVSQAVTDSAAATDAAAAELVAADAVADSAAASDAAEATASKDEAVADSAAATDTATASAVLAEAVSDAAAGSETAAAVATFAEAVSDSAAASEAVSDSLGSVTYNESASDTAAASETVASTAVLGDAVSDTADATETVAGSLAVAESASDSASATDAATVSAVLVEAVADSAAGSEAVTDELGAATYNESVEDVASAADSIGSTASIWEVLADLAAGSDIVVANTPGAETYPLAGDVQPYPMSSSQGYPLSGQAQAYPVSGSQTYPLSGQSQIFPLQ